MALSGICAKLLTSTNRTRQWTWWQKADSGRSASVRACASSRGDCNETAKWLLSPIEGKIAGHLSLWNVRVGNVGWHGNRRYRTISIWGDIMRYTSKHMCLAWLCWLITKLVLTVMWAIVELKIFRLLVCVIELLVTLAMGMTGYKCDSTKTKAIVLRWTTWICRPRSFVDVAIRSTIGRMKVLVF